MYHIIRQQLAEHSLLYLKTNYSEQIKSHPVLQQMSRKWEENSRLTDDALMTEESKAIYLDILSEQRQWLLNKNRQDQTLDEDIIRRHLLYLDLEEEKLKFV